ncbi:toxin-antitoxin system YwqK family antitoxin [Ekhidna sp.]|uniref:toxin-antitoxin system YwqK family antitoxin n=1 Tax=Ekhidna sp. TaxID=2608089 RepID=UPI003B5004BE
MNKTQILLALVIISIIGMSSSYLEMFNLITNETTDDKEPIVKHGEIRQFTKDNKLKTVVNYNQGIKHGTSYLYHDDGETILLAMPYVNGKREGASKKYYENGKLYAATSYKNDKLDGIRKIYYSNGKLKAKINYGFGYPGIGTKEFLLDGTAKNSISIKTRNEGDIIWLETSEPCKDQKFYIGTLIQDKFLDPVDQNIKLLMYSNGHFFIDTEVYTPSYLKYKDIICSCESTQGNPIIIKSRLF